MVYVKWVDPMAGKQQTNWLESMPPVALAAQSTLLLLPTCRMRNLHLLKTLTRLDSTLMPFWQPALPENQTGSNWQRSPAKLAALVASFCCQLLLPLLLRRWRRCHQSVAVPVSAAAAAAVVCLVLLCLLLLCTFIITLTIVAICQAFAFAFFPLQAFLREKLRGKCRQAINFIVIYA